MYIAIGFIAGVSYVACGSSSSDGLAGASKISPAFAGTGGELTTNSLVGAWKGNVYTNSPVQHPDFTLTLNADGTLTCSGFIEDMSTGTMVDTSPWVGICESPVAWVVTKTTIRITYNYFGEIRAKNFIVLLQDNSTLALANLGGNIDITELTKQ